MFVVLDHFLPLQPLDNLEFKMLKLKKLPGDIIILHRCTINDINDINHMMYGSWDTKCDRKNFLSFWAIFCTFFPLTTQKIKILKKIKKKTNTWTYYFTQVYHKWQSYDIWFLKYEGWKTEFLSFCTVFCPLTPLTTRKIKILKNWKKQLKISSFYTSVPKIMIICHTFP